MGGTLDADDAIAKTIEQLKQENVNIAEAAFRVGNMFVRADIIEKKGNVINLIEVKAKSWNPREDSFEVKNGKSTNKAIRPYLYDVAFQKYVIVQSMKEMFPEKNFKVNAFLMLADKSRNATVNGLNQLFTIKTDLKGKSYVQAAAKYNIVTEGTRHTVEFAAFLKETFGVSSNFVSADFRKMRTDSFQKSGTTRFRKIRVVR